MSKWVKLSTLFVSISVLFFFAIGQSFAEEITKWWPLEIFYVTDCPKNVSLTEKIANGKVHYDQYTPPMKATRPYKLGVLFPTLKDPWWLGCAYGLYDECKRLGLEAILLEAGGYDNIEKQVNQMEDLAQQGVDAILLGNISFEGLDPLVAEIDREHVAAVGL